MVNTEHWCYSIRAQLGDRSKEIRIRWNIVRCPDSGHGHWQSIQYFSTLPQVWVPSNGIEMFQYLMVDIEKQWVALCDSKQSVLNESVGVFCFPSLALTILKPDLSAAVSSK